MPTPLIRIDEPIAAPPPAPGPPRFALWDLGFRPFYLLASAFAALSIALWALQFAGLLGGAYLRGALWHAHEMVFGFALAVIVGFLFTAGRNWTNRPTPTGPRLAALAALWLAGRVLVLSPFPWLAALVNVAFPLAAAAAIAAPFVAARNRRNYFFVTLLVLLAVAQGAFHLAQLGVVALGSGAAIQVALDVVLFIVVVMAGRVVPMFTNNGVPGAQAQRHPLVERVALGSVLALLAADVLQPGAAALAGAIAAVAAAAHLARALLWQPWTTRRTPLVWVLHAAYAWVPLHLALRAAAAAGLVLPTIAAHALTVGAVGALIAGMMTRTARGHTARPLVAGRAEIACYALILLAAAVRVFVPLAVPSATAAAALVSGLLWSAGFGVFAVAYWPVLTRARRDGKPG